LALQYKIGASSGSWYEHIVAMSDSLDKRRWWGLMYDMKEQELNAYNMYKGMALNDRKESDI
jgi:hypothetical protein